MVRKPRIMSGFSGAILPDAIFACGRIVSAIKPDIAYACVWRAPHGLLAQFPDLKVIFNLGAGADHTLADPALPDLPLVRAANPNLSMRVTEYCVLHALMFHRRQRLYDAQQRERVWKGHEQPAASDVTVGVMGLGVIGAHAAETLSRVGFKVVGWSASPKQIPGIETFAGPQLDAFLGKTEILIVLLPSTPATEGILNLSLLRKLKRDGAAGGAFLINAGRGKLQIDADILAALDEGVARGRRARRVSGRAVAVRQPIVGASESHGHAA